MDSSSELNEHIVISVLDELRTSPKSKREVRLFEKVVKSAWKELKLEGSPNSILLENMLIDTIKGLYSNADSESVNDDIRREHARKFDVSLLMFGLLDGYYHTNLDSDQKVCVPLKIRYEQYLSTNIFTDLEYPGEGKYEDIKAADKKANRKQSRPLNLIMAIAGECKTEIATSLFKSIQSGAYKNCSQDAKFDETTGQRTDLPKPRFTLDNFSPRGGMPEPEPAPSPDYIRIQKQRDAAIATTVVLFIILCCIGVWSIYSNYKASIDKNNLPSVKRIILSKEDITVKPGIPEELEPTVIPNEAGIDGLECEPKNKNLVRVENFRIVVNDGWQEETDYTTTIKVYVKDDVDIYAEATVTVEPPVNIPDPPPNDIHNPVLDGSIEKNADSNWNDYTE